MPSSVFKRLQEKKQLSRTNQNSSNITDDNGDLPQNLPAFHDSVFAQNSVLSQNPSFHYADAQPPQQQQFGTAIFQSPIQTNPWTSQLPPKSPQQIQTFKGSGTSHTSSEQLTNVKTIEDVIASFMKSPAKVETALLKQIPPQQTTQQEPTALQQVKPVQTQPESQNKPQKPRSIQEKLKEHSIRENSIAITEKKVEIEQQVPKSDIAMQKEPVQEELPPEKETCAPQTSQGGKAKQSVEEPPESKIPAMVIQECPEPQIQVQEKPVLQEVDRKYGTLMKSHQALQKRFEQQQGILQEARSRLQSVGEQHKRLLDRYELEKLQAQKKIQLLTDEITDKNGDLKELANEILRYHEIEKENSELNSRNEQLQQMIEEQQSSLSRLTNEYMEMKAQIGRLRYEVQAKQIFGNEMQKSVEMPTLVHEKPPEPVVTPICDLETQFDPSRVLKSQRNRKSRVAMQE